MKYERLTAYSKINNDYITPYCDKFICDGCCRECDYEQVIINRLADFENKIENGTLVELPCKVGTKIYIVGESDFCIPKYQMWEDEFCLEDIERFGDTVFLTKAEAEKRLKELRGEYEQTQ